MISVMDLQKLLKEEEKYNGVKMGYIKGCSRSGDWYWKNEFWKGMEDGMIIDLIDSGDLNNEQLEDLIECKSSTHCPSCCDSYFAIEVY